MEALGRSSYHLEPEIRVVTLGDTEEAEEVLPSLEASDSGVQTCNRISKNPFRILRVLQSPRNLHRHLGVLETQ